ncbi:MAG: formimidoylglutamase [Fusobacteriaceae bacterium]
MQWSGRVDGYEEDVLRIHQVVKVMKLEELEKEDKTKKKVCFVAFGSDEGVIRNLGRAGANNGWKHVKQMLAGFPIFDNEISFYDLKDPILVFHKELEEAQKEIAQVVTRLKKKGYFVVVIGGGHEVAYGTYHGILDVAKENYLKPKIGIINFDAHFDMRDYSNGPTSGTMFLQIADECRDSQRVFDYNVFGIQKFGNTKRLFHTAIDHKVNYWLAESMHCVNSETMMDIISRNDYTHLTICTDVFHISSAPGVSAPQPFGLKPENIIGLLKTVAKHSKDLTLDIAEMNPNFDFDERTARLLAYIIYELILARFHRERELQF